ncbi:hypothetical protein ACQKD0_14610, partial [Vreelandella aquamarina]|uniref:hypothetical protein n=1 Tax=Vreelandella aquamarina TaxID=77097 RepID=UPI003CFE4EBD
ALIIGDLSPSSASAHMNYLIKLLKSNFLKFAVLHWLDDLNRVASARKAYSTHFLVFVNRCFSE